MSTEKEMRDAYIKWLDTPCGEQNEFKAGWQAAIANQSQLLARLEQAEKFLAEYSKLGNDSLPYIWMEEAKHILEQAK